MQAQKKDLAFYLNPLFYESKEIKQKYNEWYAAAKIIQIRAISILTALLYIIYSQIDVAIVTSSVLPVMTLMHLYVLPLSLFIIVALTFSNTYHRLMVLLLAVAPIVAAIGNLYIISRTNAFTVYLPELYLIVIWVFTLSGLRLMYAAISASLIFVIGILSGHYLSFQYELLLMHDLWLFSAFSFGILSAFIMEKSHKLIFLNKQKLEYAATTDGLTGLCNRLKVEINVEEEVQRAKRYGREFSVILFDVDDFKDVNDSYGHHVGDVVLKELSSLMQGAVRRVDTIGRWGGEEFVVVLPETSLEIAKNIAEQLRSKIESYAFTVAKQKTCSFGVSEYLRGDNVQSIINRADKALYKAKEYGKNQVQAL